MKEEKAGLRGVILTQEEGSVVCGVCLPPIPPCNHQVAAGGLQIAATMGANVGPQVYVFNFTSVGIAITGGHEAMVGCCLAYLRRLLCCWRRCCWCGS